MAKFRRTRRAKRKPKPQRTTPEPVVYDGQIATISRKEGCALAISILCRIKSSPFWEVPDLIRKEKFPQEKEKYRTVEHEDDRPDYHELAGHRLYFFEVILLVVWIHHYMHSMGPHIEHVDKLHDIFSEDIGELIGVDQAQLQEMSAEERDKRIFSKNLELFILLHQVSPSMPMPRYNLD